MILFFYICQNFNIKRIFMKKKNFIEFDGGETQLPDNVRSASPKELSLTTKFVYLALKWVKGVLREDFSPSYKFMNKRFGISSISYSKALKELSEAEVIKVGYSFSGEKKFLKIDMLGRDNVSDRIPSVILTTECLTTQQKVFLAMLWKLMYVDGDIRSVSTSYSPHAIDKHLKGLGLSRTPIYNRITELSSPDSGFINILEDRGDGCLSINLNILYALWQYEDDLWAKFKHCGGKKDDYPVYKKPKAGDFIFDGRKIVKL